MSYRSERQCQFCVDRVVAQTELRPLGLQMHNVRHQPKAIQVRVWASACILQRWGYFITSVATSYVTWSDVTFVWSGKLRLVLLFGTCHDDYDYAHNLLLFLLFLSLNPVFLCVLTEQPSGQLQKSTGTKR